MFKCCLALDNDPITPYVIVTNFENTNERKCGKIDEKNEKTYSILLKKASRAEKTIENSGLSMNLEVPIPPHPSNRDRYILWKKRNVKKHVIPQSEAIVFLQENNYKLNEHYEAYQAIDLMNEIKKSKGLPIEEEDKSMFFDNVYTHTDKNILRRKSISCHRNIRPQVQHFETLSEHKVNRLMINKQHILEDFNRERSNSLPNQLLNNRRRVTQTSKNNIVVSVYPNISDIDNDINDCDVTNCNKNIPIASAPPQNNQRYSESSNLSC